MTEELKPCPFCSGKAEMERPGTPRQSCIVACTDCGARHEGPDEGVNSGAAWNRRAPEASASGDAEALHSELTPCMEEAPLVVVRFFIESRRIIGTLDQQALDAHDNVNKGIAALRRLATENAALRAASAPAVPPSLIADPARVIEWARSNPRKPAQTAFTDGPERQAAYWIEWAQTEAESAPAVPPQAYEQRLAEVMPLFQEARDALPAISTSAAKLHGVSLTLAERMDAVGTKDWRTASPAPQPSLDVEKDWLARASLGGKE